MATASLSPPQLPSSSSPPPSQQSSSESQFKQKISVSQLIRKLNFLVNGQRHQYNYSHLTNNCICVLRLCTNESSINDTCPVHGPVIYKNKLVKILLQSFIIEKKNIIYMNTKNWSNIVYDKYIYIMLPLVIHIYQHQQHQHPHPHPQQKQQQQQRQQNQLNSFHFHNSTIPTQLNNVHVSFTNLLILNVLTCNAKDTNKYINYNRLLNRSKAIEFKYILLLNCDLDISHKYITKHENNFKFHIGALINQQLP